MTKDKERTCYLCFQRLLEEFPDHKTGWDPTDLDAITEELPKTLRDDPYTDIDYPMCAVGYCH